MYKLRAPGGLVRFGHASLLRSLPPPGIWPSQPFAVEDKEYHALGGLIPVYLQCAWSPSIWREGEGKSALSRSLLPFAQPRGWVAHISCNQLVYRRVMLEGFSVVSISPWLGSAARLAQTQVWGVRPALGGPWRSRRSHHLATCPCDDIRCV